MENFCVKNKINFQLLLEKSQLKTTVLKRMFCLYNSVFQSLIYQKVLRVVDNQILLECKDFHDFKKLYDYKKPTDIITKISQSDYMQFENSLKIFWPLETLRDERTGMPTDTEAHNFYGKIQICSLNNFESQRQMLYKGIQKMFSLMATLKVNCKENISVLENEYLEFSFCYNNAILFVSKYIYFRDQLVKDAFNVNLISWNVGEIIPFIFIIDQDICTILTKIYEYRAHFTNLCFYFKSDINKFQD